MADVESPTQIPGVACQAAYAPLDVVGFNEYFGWYDAGGGLTDDRDALSPFLDSWRACYPNKALFITEFGFEQAAMARWRSAEPTRFRPTPWPTTSMSSPRTRGYQARSTGICRTSRLLPAGPALTRGPTPPFLQKGLFDLQGHAKPAEPVLTSIYHRTQQIGVPAASPKR